MNLNCTEGPATQPCTALWSQGVYRSRSVAHSSTTATAPNPAKVSDRVQQTKIPTYQHTNISSHQSVEPPHGGARTTDLRDACRYVSNVHSTAAPPSRPAHSQQPTHTDTHPLAARGAYTRARPDSPNASRSGTAPKRYTTELLAGGCPKPTGRRPTDPQPTIATARASPVESNALNGPTRLTATMPRRARTGSPQLNLRSDGRRLRSASGSNCPALLKTACSAIGAIQLRRDARLRRRLWVTSSTIPQ